MDTLTGTPTEQLMPILKFTQHDLDENRHGVLTDSQRKRVWRWQGFIALVLGLVLVAIVVVFMIYGSGPQDDPGIQAVNQTFRLAIVFIFVPFIGGLFWFQNRTVSTLKRGKVASTTGRMRLEYTRHRGNNATYTLVMPDKRFNVSEEVFGTFIDGKTYTLYYVPQINYLLSAEHHDTTPDKQK